jgi:hypothetical protein
MGAESRIVGGRVMRSPTGRMPASPAPRCSECVHARTFGAGACAFCTHGTGLRSGQVLTREQAACTMFAPRA